MTAVPAVQTKESGQVFDLEGEGGRKEAVAVGDDDDGGGGAEDKRPLMCAYLGYSAK